MTTLEESSMLTSRPAAGPVWASTSLTLGAQQVSVPPITLTLPGDVDARKRRMFDSATDQINRLRAMNDGWDGSKASRINDISVIVALNLIGFLVDFDIPLPQIFPLADGGIQLEWLIDGDGLEIQVSPDGEVNSLGNDRDGFTRIDSTGAAGPAMSEIKSYLGEISKPLSVR